MLRRHFLAAGLALAAFGSAFPAFAQSKGPVIGVSWSNFQEERWKTDEAAIKAAITNPTICIILFSRTNR